MQVRQFLAALLCPLVSCRAPHGPPAALPPPAGNAPPPAPTSAIPYEELGARYELLGKTGQPLGKVIRVQGRVVEGPFKGYEGGPNLRVQRVDGIATQKDI